MEIYKPLKIVLSCYTNIIYFELIDNVKLKFL